MKIYDALIIGGGVAGISAAIYAKRRGKNVAIIEKFTLGGQVVSLNKIENFPSQAEIDGFSLSQMFLKQVKHLDIEVIHDDIKKVDFSKDIKVLYGKTEYMGKSVVIATGLSSVELGKNENEFFGRGVSYCAVCDANFYKNQVVCVASKNGSGIKGALDLAEVCSKVIVLDSGDMSKYASVNRNEKIEIVSNVDIERVEGKEVLNKVVVNIAGKQEELTASALFIELGKKPKTDIYKDFLDLDNNGFIKTDANMRTSIKGVFAVGDVRNGFLKQIVTGCSDGAIAGQLV